MTVEEALAERDKLAKQAEEVRPISRGWRSIITTNEM